MNQLARIDTAALANLSRALIGFDRMFSDFDRSQARSDNYPPHNIIKTGENTYAIEMAVAGFAKEEISIEVENNHLSIAGQKAVTAVQESQDDVIYLHRGLASRDFIKVFPLAEHIEVGEAELTNGILTVKLIRIVPEALKPRVVNIKG